jgi:hypothetical protein
MAQNLSQMAQLPLGAKGLSARQIADLTGWDQSTIARDLQKHRDANASKDDANASPPANSTTTHAAKEDRAATISSGATASWCGVDRKRFQIGNLYCQPPILGAVEAHRWRKAF